MHNVFFTFMFGGLLQDTSIYKSYTKMHNKAQMQLIFTIGNRLSVTCQSLDYFRVLHHFLRTR